MRRLICLVLSLTIAFGLLSGCKPNNKSSIIYYITSEPQTLDPQTAADYYSKLICANSFEGLMKLSVSGEIQMALAESFTYEPALKRYTFVLKDNLKWSNGEALTAYDFAFAFERLFDKNTGAVDVERFFCVKNAEAVYNGEANASLLGVKAIDDKTLIFTLEYDFHGFLELLTLPQAMPCNEEFFISTKGKYGLEYNKVIFSGPMSVYAWYHNEALYLKKNENYYDPKPVPSVLSVFITKEESAVSAFEDGKNDLLLSNVSLGNRYNKTSYDDKTYGLLFNAKSEVFSNRNLRLALSYSFKRESFAQSLSENFVVDSAFCYKNLENFSYNAEKAKNYLSLAYNELEIDRVSKPKIICKKGTDQKEIISFALQVWQEELDIYFVAEELGENDFNLALKEGNYDIALTAFTVSYDGGLKFVSDVRSMVNDSVKIDKHINSFYRAASNNEANLELEKAIEVIENETIFLPAYKEIKYLYVNDEVKNIVYNPATEIIDFTKAKK